MLRKVKHSVKNKDFSNSSQQDSHEFLTTVLNQISVELTAASRLAGVPSAINVEKQTPEEWDYLLKQCATNSPAADVISKTFGFNMQQLVKCEYVTRRKEFFAELMVADTDMLRKNRRMRLEDLLVIRLGEEPIEHYKCDDCGRIGAISSNLMTHLPDIMVIQVKRYVYNMITNTVSKSKRAVVFPKFLALDKYYEHDPMPDTVIMPDVEKVVDKENKNVITDEPEQRRASRKRRREQSPAPVGCGEEITNDWTPMEVKDHSTGQMFKQKIKKEESDDGLEARELQQALEASLHEYADKVSRQGEVKRVEDMAESDADVIEEVPQQTKQEYVAATGNEQFAYRLTTVLSHMGETDLSGHYICDVYKPGTDTWQSCDDSSVTTIPEKQVLTNRQKTAYILLYTRIKNGDKVKMELKEEQISSQ